MRELKPGTRVRTISYEKMQLKHMIYSRDYADRLFVVDKCVDVVSDGEVYGTYFYLTIPALGFFVGDAAFTVIDDGDLCEVFCGI